MNLFLNRLFRAAKLDAGLYDEVIADPKTMFQAMMAVFIYSAASAYGGFGRAGSCRNQFRNDYHHHRMVHLGFFNLFYWREIIT